MTQPQYHRQNSCFCSSAKTSSRGKREYFKAKSLCRPSPYLSLLQAAAWVILLNEDIRHNWQTPVDSDVFLMEAHIVQYSYRTCSCNLAEFTLKV